MGTRSRSLVDDFKVTTRSYSGTGLRKSERDQVAVSGTDLDGVHVEHPIAIVRQIGRARRVAVVGHDHELQAGARGGSQYLVDGSGAVRSVRMNVDDTTDRRLQTRPKRWQFTRRTRKGR